MKKLYVAGILGLAVYSTGVLAKMGAMNVPFIPGEVLVKLRSGKLGPQLKGKLGLGMVVRKELNLLHGQYLLLKSHSKSTKTLVQELEALPEVIFAEPNYIYKISGLDPMYGKLWGLKNTGANEPDRNGGTSGTVGVSGADLDMEKAWKITKGSKKVVIAVIDTGIDYNHPDLKNNIWVNEKEIKDNGLDDDANGFVDDIHGWNAHDGNGDPMDGNSHGTHCAGTIGAEHGNSIGVAGVMDDVRLMAVKFLDDEGSGSLADAIAAIDYATKMNVDVMSNSWGGGGYSQALADAITTARKKGIAFIAAAGNEATNNDTRPSYPASYNGENIISVGSHTAQDTLSTFSNTGRKTVHVVAPGTNILSTVPNGQYKVLSGTSMATPHVAGVVGLLIAERGRVPLWELRSRLMATTVPRAPYRKTTASGGRVSAYNFLTNTKIPRETPDDNAWKVESLAEAFETAHPYKDNTKLSKTYTFPGAKYVKFVIEKFDTESGYDYVTLKDAKGALIEKISGAGQNYESDYAETNSVTVEFTSDSSQTRWGVAIKEVKVIY